MVAWPTDRQFCPLKGSFQESPPENAIRSSMDKGPDKVRRRTTANVRNIAFRLYLSPDNVQVLDNFFENLTFSGAIEFDYNHPRTGQAVKARFVQPPSYSDRSTGYDVSVSLEILP